MTPITWFLLACSVLVFLYRIHLERPSPLGTDRLKEIMRERESSAAKEAIIQQKEYLRSQVSYVRKLLDELGPNHFLERYSLQSHLDEVEAELRALERLSKDGD